MKNIKSRISKISVINASYFEKNNEMKFEKKINGRLILVTKNFINSLETEKIKCSNNVKSLLDFFTILEKESIITNTKDINKIDYNELKAYDKYNYDIKELKEFLKDYLDELAREDHFEEIKVRYAIDRARMDEEDYHTFLGDGSYLLEKRLYSMPKPPYGDELSWDNYCIRKNKKEYCIEALCKAYMYNKIEEDYINAVVKKVCSYLGHDYKPLDDEYLYCECINCHRKKKVDSITYNFDSARREITPGKKISEYMDYISSINIEDYFGIKQKNYVINKQYFHNSR